MDISRTEQRILHLLAQGGRIQIEKNQKKRIASVKCLTRDGWHYPGVDLDLFRPTDAPDAFLHEEPSYATWTPQIHRAP